MYRSAKVVPIDGKTPITTATTDYSAALARLPAPLHRCRELLARHFRKDFPALFSAVDDTLFELADKAGSSGDQQFYFEAMRELRLQRQTLEDTCLAQIERGFLPLLGAQTPAESAVSGISADTLSLLDNEQLERQVALEAMAQRQEAASADQLQLLSMRFDTLVPAKVYIGNNPLRAVAVCEAFAVAIAPLAVDIRIQLLLLKLFEKHVLCHYPELLIALNTYLAEQNILPHLTVAGVARSARPAAAAPASAPAAHLSAAAPLPADNLLAQYQQLVHGGQSGQSSGVMAAGAMPMQAGGGSVPGSYAPALRSLLSGLQQAQTLPMGGPVAGTLPVTAADFIRQIQQQGLQVNPADVDVITLVTMLFEYMLEDQTLAPAMKSMLARLQIPMIRVALQDRGFFGTQGHPARRLLNELAAAAVGWNESADSAGSDPLVKQIDGAVGRLLREYDDNAELFPELLTDFLAFTERDRRRASIIEKRTLDAEQGKATAERARATVDALVSSKLEGQALPLAVSSLLTGPWSNLLFLLCLKNGEGTPEWDQAVAVIDDLIWSVSAVMGSDERKHLLALLPNLLRQLREGLDQVSYNPYETSQLFRELEQCHLRQLKPVAAPAPEMPVAVAVPPPAAAPAAPTSGLVPSGFEDTAVAPEVPETPAQTQTRPASADAALPTPAEAFLFQVDQLTQGSWLDMLEDDGTHYRCRLAAIIRSADKFIFVNRNGMKVAEKSRVEIALALQQQRLVLLENGQLFERALESVIGGLRRRSVS